ncbi:hypothetical protein D3C79_948390 [compost metagenome]
MEFENDFAIVHFFEEVLLQADLTRIVGRTKRVSKFLIRGPVLRPCIASGGIYGFHSRQYISVKICRDFKGSCRSLDAAKDRCTGNNNIKSPVGTFIEPGCKDSIYAQLAGRGEALQLGGFECQLISVQGII